MDEQVTQRVILADGTTYDNGGCGDDGYTLYVNLRGTYNLVDIMQKFMAPANIAHIVMEAGDITSVFDGFTVIQSICQINPTYIAIVLKRPGGE